MPLGMKVLIKGSLPSSFYPSSCRGLAVTLVVRMTASSHGYVLNCISHCQLFSTRHKCPEVGNGYGA